MANHHGGAVPEGYGGSAEELPPELSAAEQEELAKSDVPEVTDAPADECQPSVADQDELTAATMTSAFLEDVLTQYVKKIKESVTKSESLVGRSAGVSTSVNVPPPNLSVKEQAWMLPINRLLFKTVMGDRGGELRQRRS
ncbi:MAG TPA: hypothetical protein VMR18_01000 [Candidatus Saccharimonadales bacterium]|nr:hypothetical protein [Candidatus Saccharimonadales bacterium]